MPELTIDRSGNRDRTSGFRTNMAECELENGLLLHIAIEDIVVQNYVMRRTGLNKINQHELARQININLLP